MPRTEINLDNKIGEMLDVRNVITQVEKGVEGRLIKG